MADKHRAEPVQPGNPYQLTRAQHVHSHGCIERFGERVCVRLRNGHTFSARPNNRVFTVERVWSQRLERGLFRDVENSFQPVADEIVAGGIPSDFTPLLQYLAIWQIRADLAEHPPEDVRLNFPGSDRRQPHLTKDQEECLEAHGRVDGKQMGIGVAYLRGDTMPGRMVCESNVMRQFEMLTWPTLRFDWKILRSSGRHFICPDTPRAKLYIPLSPTVSVLGREFGAGTEAIDVTDTQVEELNRDCAASCAKFVFGALDDL